MAERCESSSKKRKLEHLDPIFELFLNQRKHVEWLHSGLAALNHGLEGCKIRTIKITDANARRPVSFTRASIFFGDNYKTYSMGRVFSKGYSVLSNYLQSDLKNESISLPDDVETKNALALLLHYLQNSEKEMKVLAEHPSSQEEWCWTLKLAQHVFSKLSLNSKYHYDISKVFDSTIGCPCTEHDILVGEKADTSFGWEGGWHGRIDIVMGDVPVCILSDSNHGDGASCSNINSPVSSEHSFVDSESSIDIEVKRNSDFTYSDYCQIIAETIAFSFLKNKNTPKPVSLIPSIAVNKEGIQVHLYDSENDVLLQSGFFPLASCYGEDDSPDIPVLSPLTVLVIWMSLNHKLFCTGVVKEMPSSGFHKIIDLDTFKKDIKAPCNLKRYVDEKHIICDKEWAFKSTVIPAVRIKEVQENDSNS